MSNPRSHDGDLETEALSFLGRRLLDRWIYVLVKVGKDFLLPYHVADYRRMVDEGGYGHLFAPYLDAWLSLLDEGDWGPGHYFPGKGYRALMDGDENLESPAHASPSNDDIQACYQDEVRVDPAGRWYLGEKHITGKVLTFFQANLHFNEQVQRFWIGYRIEDRIETRYLHHESPPIRITRIVPVEGGFEVLLNTGGRERLRHDDLWLDQREELFCNVTPHRVPGWFEEAPRWELLKDGEEDEGRWQVRIGAEIVHINRIGQPT